MTGLLLKHLKEFHMIRLAVSGLVLLVFLVGCSTKSTVVLLPNPDGSIGEIEVTSETGSQRLTQANQATEVKNQKSEPSAPEILSDKEITRTFGEVIAISPEPPENFILYFKFDSAALSPQSENLFPEIVKAIKKRKSKGMEIVVSGHTDRVGDKAYNIKLSIKRANRIKDKLVFLGIDAALIEVTSHGEGNPLIKTADNVSEPRNRRVEVTVK